MKLLVTSVGLIRRHPAFGILLVAAIALRLVVMIAYRPALLFQSDAYVYLQRALDLEPSHFRPVFYSAFLKPFLATRNLFAVVAVQHVMVLALIALIYLMLNRRGVPPSLAALGVAPLALDAYQLDIEHYVLAEVLFQVLTAGALIVLMWDKGLRAPAAAFSGALLGLSGITRFLGLGLILPAVLYAWRRGGFGRAIVLAVTAAVPLLLYATWFNSHHGSFALTDRDGYFLYARVAVFADCDGLEVEPYQRVLCDDQPIAERENPNFYVFDEDSPAQAVEIPEGMDRDAVLRDYARAVVVQQPARYAATVLKGFAHYFAAARTAGPHDNRLAHWRFPIDVTHAEPQAFRVRKFEGSPPPNIDESRFRIAPAPARALRWYQSWAYTHGPLLAIFVLAAFVGVFRSSRARPEILVLSASGILLLLIPIATVTFDYRFMLLSLPFLPPAAALATARDEGASSPARELVT